MAGIGHGGKLPKLWECIGRLDRTAADRAVGGRRFWLGFSEIDAGSFRRSSPYGDLRQSLPATVLSACTLNIFAKMSTYPLNTISDMMEQYAAEAVRLASESGITLDYSESSLEALERFLNDLAHKYPSSETELRSEDSMQKELDSVSRIWGGYFGETIRRLWGGEWGVETYPGTIAPVISVDIGGAKLFPVMKIYRRLTKGEDENVWRFYQMVRGRVSEGRKQ